MRKKEKTARDVFNKWPDKVADHESVEEALWEYMDYPEKERDYDYALFDIDDHGVTEEFEEFLMEHFGKWTRKFVTVQAMEAWLFRRFNEKMAVAKHDTGMADMAKFLSPWYKVEGVEDGFVVSYNADDVKEKDFERCPDYQPQIADSKAE